MTKTTKYVSLALRIIIAIILVQTLRFKFTAHPDSVYIFTKVGLEPYGRIGIGILELIAAILILIPITIWIGSLMTIGIISGAIVLHLTKLGIIVNGDNGLLFYTALLLLILSVITLWIYRRELPFYKIKS
jgi:uncharacterized membrane protein YphA (DoxX/SURF4 family)